MLCNYFPVALRSLRKSGVSTLVNMIGLAVGMAAFVLIIQFVRYEFSYDRIRIIVPVLLVLVITLLTVSSQVLKTANANPAEFIRYE